MPSFQAHIASCGTSVANDFGKLCHVSKLPFLEGCVADLAAGSGRVGKVAGVAAFVEKARARARSVLDAKSELPLSYMEFMDLIREQPPGKAEAALKNTVMELWSAGALRYLDEVGIAEGLARGLKEIPKPAGRTVWTPTYTPLGRVLAEVAGGPGAAYAVPLKLTMVFCERPNVHTLLVGLCESGTLPMSVGMLFHEQIHHLQRTARPVAESTRVHRKVSREDYQIMSEIHAFTAQRFEPLSHDTLHGSKGDLLSLMLAEYRMHPASCELIKLTEATLQDLYLLGASNREISAHLKCERYNASRHQLSNLHELTKEKCRQWGFESLEQLVEARPLLEAAYALDHLAIRLHARETARRETGIVAEMRASA